MSVFRAIALDGERNGDYLTCDEGQRFGYSLGQWPSVSKENGEKGLGEYAWYLKGNGFDDGGS